MPSLASLLKKKMAADGLTPESIVKKALKGLTVVQVQGYLDGRFPNSRNDAIAKVAKFLGVTEEKIISMKPARGSKAAAPAKPAKAKKAAPAKKGPGRPKKAAAKAPAKKGPGRPKKAAAAAPAKKGPGRPKKDRC